MKDENSLIFHFDNDEDLIPNFEKLFDFSSGYFADWFIMNYFQSEKWSIGVYIHTEPKEDISKSHRLYNLRPSAFNLCARFFRIKSKIPETVHEVIHSFIGREIVKYQIGSDGLMLNLGKYN